MTGHMVRRDLRPRPAELSPLRFADDGIIVERGQASSPRRFRICVVDQYIVVLDMNAVQINRPGLVEMYPGPAQRSEARTVLPDQCKPNNNVVTKRNQ